ELADLIIPHSVNMIFIDEVRGIVDQKLSDGCLPEREGKAAGHSLIDEVQAAVVVARARLEVPEIQTLVVSEEPASMIVYDIEYNRDPVHVAKVDHYLELIGAVGDLTQCE